MVWLQGNPHDKALGTSSTRRVVGVEGVKDRQLDIPNRYDRTCGPCMTDMMQLEGTYQKGDNTAELLRPFFENVVDQCGVQRSPLQG